jgi:sigma-70-like protein
MDSKHDPNAAQSAALGPSEVHVVPIDGKGVQDLDAHGGAPFDAAMQTDGALALNADSLPAPVTREQRRSRRKRAIRARTISVKRMTKRELELGRMLYPEVEEIEHPSTRADCVGGERPCPFVSCKHHLYLDVSARTGAIKLNFPDLEVWEMTETCALDVADRGGTTLEEVGAIMNLTRERIRQVEVKGLAKLAALRDMSTLRDYVDEGPTGKRRLPVLAAPPEEDEVDEDEAEDAEDPEVAAEEAEAAVPVEVNVDAFSVDLDAE